MLTRYRSVEAQVQRCRAGAGSEVQRCREGGGAVMFDVCSSCAVLHAEVLSGWRGSEGAEVQRCRGAEVQSVDCRLQIAD